MLWFIPFFSWYFFSSKPFCISLLLVVDDLAVSMVLHRPMLTHLFQTPPLTDSSLCWPSWSVASISFLVMGLWEHHFLPFRRFRRTFDEIRCVAHYKTIYHLGLSLPWPSAIVEVLTDEVNHVLLLESDRCLYFAGGYTFAIDNSWTSTPWPRPTRTQMPKYLWLSALLNNFCSCIHHINFWYLNWNAHRYFYVTFSLCFQLVLALWGHWMGGRSCRAGARCIQTTIRQFCHRFRFPPRCRPEFQDSGTEEYLRLRLVFVQHGYYKLSQNHQFERCTLYLSEKYCWASNLYEWYSSRANNPCPGEFRARSALYGVQKVYYLFNLQYRSQGLLYHSTQRVYTTHRSGAWRNFWTYIYTDVWAPS